jgi:CheY-like chemotaxis protein
MRESILVVEDDKDTRELLREILESESYRVTLASSGEVALQQLAEGMQPDLVILDLVMPVMGGWELLRLVRQQPAFAAVPVLVMSASVPKRRPPTSGTFLRKPFKLDDLLDAVARLCHPQEHPAPPSVERPGTGSDVPEQDEERPYAMKAAGLPVPLGRAFGVQGTGPYQGSSPFGFLD